MILLGLDLIKNLFTCKSHEHEKKKTIISTTFGRTFLRGLIHFLPILVSILLICMNLKHLYIGPDLNFLSLTTTNSLASFQVAAKIQELLAVTSMTTVLFEIIRFQLLYGEGLPLGLLSSGYTFSKFEFFSKTTWVWFRSKSARWQKTFFLFCLTFIAILALVIGPASAVLMLPRPVDQVVYTTHFWLNGNSEDLFPTRLTEAHIGHPLNSNVSDPNPCTVNNSFMNDHCISRAYQKMQALLDSAPNTVHWDWTAIFRDNAFTRVLALHEHVETWTRAPHVATAYGQNILWWDPTWFNRFRQSPSGRVSVVNSQAANVRTVCLGQNVTISTTQIQFPLLELYSTYLKDNTAIISVGSKIWSQDNVSFVDPDLVRTIWIDGAQNIEAVTAGLVVLDPLESPNNTVRSALACSVDARWGDSNHIQADGPLDIAISADESYLRRDDGSGSEFLPANNSHWKHIKASMAWLDALTPTVPYLSPAFDLTKSASTIANLLMSTGHAQLPPIDRYERGHQDQDSPYEFWESLIATYFADGVARVGYSRQLDSPLFFADGSDRVGRGCVETIPVVEVNVSTCPDDRPESPNLTSFSLEGRLSDIYAYRASAKTDFASVAIISVYVCIATVHFIYCLIYRRSSRAWEKLEDLLALAHSSRPDSAVLSNTSAGMSTSGTKAKAVRIVVMMGERDGKIDHEEASEESDDEEERMEGGSVARDAFARDEEAVQMRFVDSMHYGTNFGRVKAGTKYGKMD